MPAPKPFCPQPQAASLTLPNAFFVSSLTSEYRIL